MTQVREAKVATNSIFEDFLRFGSEESGDFPEILVEDRFCQPAESTEEKVVVGGTKKTLGFNSQCRA